MYFSFYLPTVGQKPPLVSTTILGRVQVIANCKCVF